MNKMTVTITLALGLGLVAPLLSAPALGAPAARRMTLAQRKAEIDRKVKVLGNMGYGVQVHKPVAGATAEEMVINLGMTGTGEDLETFKKESFRPNADINKLAFGDEVTWGTLSLTDAQDVYTWNDSNEPTDHAGRKAAKRDKVGGPILKELSKMGVEFGYTPGSSSYCGVSFMGLLVIDRQNETVYEIALTSGGPC